MPRPVKKSRNPKTVQPGLEAAFRKRQNKNLKENRETVIDLFKRVLHEKLENTEQLSTLFQDGECFLCVIRT